MSMALYEVQKESSNHYIYNGLGRQVQIFVAHSKLADFYRFNMVEFTFVVGDGIEIETLSHIILHCKRDNTTNRDSVKKSLQDNPASVIQVIMTSPPY